VSEANALCYIPLSALKPFGITGIPSLSDSSDSVGDMLDELFNMLCGQTTADCVAIDSNIFCQMAGIKIVAIGAKEATIALSEEVRGKDNILLAVVITLGYTLPDQTKHTKLYTINPLSVFRIKRDSCNPFHN